MSPVAMAAAQAEPAPSGPMLLSPPPAPRIMELSPPPMDRFLRELTPPAMASQAAAPAPAALPAPGGSSIPLPTFELKNPWADERPRTTSATTRPTFGERLEPWKPALRTLVLAFIAASIGIAVRSALTLREPAAPPAPVVLPPAPVAVAPAAVAPVAVAPAVAAPGSPAAAGAAAPAADGIAAKVTGTLDVVAAPGAPIVVDGIERGAGPRLTIPLGTGYHMVRIGSSVSQLIQVRAKQTVTLDVTAK